MKFSALSVADQTKRVTTACPITRQCELSVSSGQVSWYKDGTKLLLQNRVDLQSEGNLRNVVVPSAEKAQTGMHHCESKDDGIQLSVEVKGDSQQLCSHFAVLHDQLTVAADDFAVM